MKIFFVARGWPSDREPQWGCFERDQALALKKLGHDIVVLSVDARFRTYYRKFGITKEIHEDIAHYDLFAGSIWGKALQKVFLKLHIKVKRALFLYLFKKVVKEEGLPDLIYAHYLGSSSMALTAKQKYGIPVVGIEHWSKLGYQNIRRSVKYWAGVVYKDLDCLITVSSALRENILRNFGVDSAVVYNMVGQEFRYKPQTRKEDKVRFVTVGNLLPIKGFDNLIMTFSRLKLPADSWELTIVGGGSEYENLRRMIKSNHFDDNIYLAGKVDRKGVIEAINSCDVYVMSSRSETFGVAAVEALACGLPVVATRCGGAADFMNDANGITCPVDNIDKLAECIGYMFNHCREYDRERIAADCQSRFSSEAIARQLTCIFEGVVKK